MHSDQHLLSLLLSFTKKKEHLPRILFTPCFECSRIPDMDTCFNVLHFGSASLSEHSMSLQVYTPSKAYKSRSWKLMKSCLL